MTKSVIIAVCLAGLLAGCSGKGPGDVVTLYYSSSVDADFDAFLSCLSPTVKQECLAEFENESEARKAFSKLPEDARKLVKGIRITRVQIHDPDAMVWVSEGNTMPEDGKVYSLSKQDSKWVITKQQLLVAFYKNGSKLDWEKPTEQDN